VITILRKKDSSSQYTMPG